MSRETAVESMVDFDLEFEFKYYFITIIEALFKLVAIITTWFWKAHH